MKLEFEVERATSSKNYVYYTIKRKGLEVGTMVLNADPYARQEAEIRNIIGETR